MIEEKELKGLERSFWIDKGIIIILLVLLFIQGVSALDYNIYSGDTISITLDKPYTYYSIINNLTEINLNITQEGNIVWITFDKYTQDDSFEIVFFDAQEVIKTIVVPSGGGGGGSTRTIVKEVIKEVDNYISVPNNTIELVENKTIEEKIINTGEVKWFMVVLGLFAVVVILILLWYFMNRMDKKYSSEIKESKELEGRSKE